MKLANKVTSFELYALKERVGRMLDRAEQEQSLSRHDYDRGYFNCALEVHDIIMAMIRQQNEAGAQFDARNWEELQNKNREDCSDYF